MRWLRSVGIGLLVACAAVSCLKKPLGEEANTPGLEKKKPLEPQPAPAMPGVNVPAIKVNTVGYPPAWTKIAIFNVRPEGAVIKNAAGTVVHEVAAGDVHEIGADRASGDPVWHVDFSKLVAPGRYVIEQGKVKSDPFEVGDGVYTRANTLALQHFYFQRCRTPLVAPYAVFEGDEFLRKEACHQHADIAWDLSEHPAKKTRWKPERGWHDAGNFEMYVPSTAPTAQALLMAYEAHPELYRDGQLNIPEAGNKIPDLLDEVRWGLDWVLSMQDPSGGFHNREAVITWSQHMSADADQAAHWISTVGTASTAKGVAVSALAARIYRDWDAKYAERCEAAARRGWAFLDAHPERITVDNGPSEQPLLDDGADHTREGGARLLASAEMWRSFREPAALEKAKALLDDPQAQVKEFLRGAWVNMARWGLIRLAMDAETPEAVRTTAAARIRQAADEIRKLAEQDGYLVASSLDDYYWGSNSNLMERTHLLLAAHRLDQSLEWALEAAKDQWHWILGRNPNGFSMVTRVGKGPTRVYHLEWGRHERMPPGLLVGGPNAKEGKFLAPGTPAKALLWDNPEPISAAIQIPAHALWHAEQEALWDGGFLRNNDWSNGWWGMTEGDIYYNANLVLVGTEMVAQMRPPQPEAQPKAEPQPNP